MNNWGFELDQFGGFLFFMYLGGIGFGSILGIFRFMLFTFLERSK